MTRTTNLRGDKIIDSRDVIARIEELESDRETALEEAQAEGKEGVTFDEAAWVWDDDDAQAELDALKSLADEAESCGDWKHGATLIRDDQFEDYAQELAEDLGLLKERDSWPYTCIDWEQAANELKQDYTSVSFDGTDYWIRS